MLLRLENLKKVSIFAEINRCTMKYSVITINFNNCEGLRKTIKSVVAQTCKNFEYIVIDGGSTDCSVSVIKEYSERINYWVSEPDSGIYNAMNKGVAQAHGDYCIFMNSGDSFFNSKVLESFSNYNMQEDLVIGNLVSSRDGSILFAPPQREISLYYLYSGTIPHQSSFIRTRLLRLYPYDENLRIVSDWKFFVEAVVMHNCSVRYINDYLALFDMEGISTTNPERMWKEKEQVLSSMFPSRVLEDYKAMKASECLTQTMCPHLRQHYTIDRLIFCIGKFFLKFVGG